MNDNKYRETSSITFYSICATDIISKYQGESESSIKQLFDSAKKNKPSIIFIDEIDFIALSRTDNDNESTRRIKSVLFLQIDMIINNPGVYVIAATNTPYNLDDAILRRFDNLIYVPLPNKLARFKMFEQRFKKEGFSNNQLNELAQRTEGYTIPLLYISDKRYISLMFFLCSFSGSEINKLSKDAELVCIKKLHRTKHFRVCGNTNSDMVMYTPCKAIDDGVIEMELKDVPADCLTFVHRTDFVSLNFSEKIQQIYTFF